MTEKCRCMTFFPFWTKLFLRYQYYKIIIPKLCLINHTNTKHRTTTTPNEFVFVFHIYIYTYDLERE